MRCSEKPSSPHWKSKVDLDDEGEWNKHTPGAIWLGQCALDKRQRNGRHGLDLVRADYVSCYVVPSWLQIPVSVRPLVLPRAQHINFGHSHPPRKIIPKCPFGIPRMNFPEFLGSAVFLAFLNSLIGNPEFQEFSGISPERGFWGPQIALSGEDEVDRLGSGDLFLYVTSSTSLLSPPNSKIYQIFFFVCDPLALPEEFFRPFE